MKYLAKKGEVRKGGEGGRRGGRIRRSTCFETSNRSFSLFLTLDCSAVLFLGRQRASSPARLLDIMGTLKFVPFLLSSVWSPGSLN